MAKRKTSFGRPPLQKKRAIAAVTTTISELPDDIICKILLRISDIKSLVRCNRVCKTWRNLILQPHFAKSHLSRGSLPLSLLLYRPSNARTNPVHFGILELNDDLASLSRQNATLKFRSEIYIRRNCKKGEVYVIGACNGLVCLRVDKDIVVCNPILPGRHFVLPKLPKLAQAAFSSFGFGYGPLSDEYKVLTCTVTSENHWYNTTLNIFTLGRDNTWRSIGRHNGQPFPGCYARGGFIFVNGALHWMELGVGSRFLCYFDVENEELGSLSLPCHIDVLTHLGVLDDFLYLSDRISLSHVHVWVMKDYIQTGAWRLKWVVKLQCLNVPFGPVLPVKVLKDGTILLIFNDKFLGSHNPQTGVTKRITYHGVRFWHESIAHTPSFLCPPWLK
ncbi:hypothetical protein Vadar_029162 [Vaccinium darrowii]|uniref:Uncharacterized protein n=1 Tax=Vaccinium darrowii TaxID=229202 RepID=A0ACB7XU12_9ERIC|nr:hypothetical protein Vadar_029162 [Vaccinium darrowii]